jgi:hypothetical protein
MGFSFAFYELIDYAYDLAFSALLSVNKTLTNGQISRKFNGALFGILNELFISQIISIIESRFSF